MLYHVRHNFWMDSDSRLRRVRNGVYAWGYGVWDKETRRRGVGAVVRAGPLTLEVPERTTWDLELEDLTEAESGELMAFTQKAIRVVKAISNPHAFNVGLNLGTSAGGSLAEHLHMHVVPRWGGDANFLPIIGRTKALPVLLEDTRQNLIRHWPT